MEAVLEVDRVRVILIKIISSKKKVEVRAMEDMAREDLKEVSKDSEVVSKGLEEGSKDSEEVMGKPEDMVMKD